MKKFILDLRQDYKNPDWTYKDPQRSTSRFVPVAPHPEGDAGVRLAPDVWTSMKMLSETKGIDVDRQVNDALRDWLKRGRK